MKANGSGYTLKMSCHAGSCTLIGRCKGLSIYYVSRYNKAGSVGMLTNAYLREQGFIKKLMSYENQH